MPRFIIPSHFQLDNTSFTRMKHALFTQTWNSRDLVHANRYLSVSSIFLQIRAQRRCTRGVERTRPSGRDPFWDPTECLWPKIRRPKLRKLREELQPEPDLFHDLCYAPAYLSPVRSHSADRKGRTTEFRRCYPNCNNEGIGCGSVCMYIYIYIYGGSTKFVEV